MYYAAAAHACRSVKHCVLVIRVRLKAEGAAAAGAMMEDEVQENAAMIASLPKEIRDCFTDNFSPKQKKQRDDSETEVWADISGKDDAWACNVFREASFWHLGIIKPWPKRQKVQHEQVEPQQVQPEQVQPEQDQPQQVQPHVTAALSFSEKHDMVQAAIFCPSFALDDERVEALRFALSLCSLEDLMRTPPRQAPLTLPGGARFEHK